jgi:serine phosphatase RsbU (regulator of sigma subunit)
MRCAYASTTCPAGDDVPGSTGGDIVAVVETSATVRVLVGDVMGHGARAGETAAEVKNAFRRLAVHEEDPPQVIAARLDRLIADREQRAHAAAMDAAEKQRRREEFVTAQFIDVPLGCAGAEPRIVNCGHPPPLILSGDRATFLEAVPSVPPLGLLSLAGDTWPQSFPFAARAGDTVLLYTDGVTEARDSEGTVYPFDGRATAVARHLDAAGEGYLDKPTANALIETLRADLLAHVGGVLRDDATLMYLSLANDPCPNTPASRDTISRAR